MECVRMQHAVCHLLSQNGLPQATFLTLCSLLYILIRKGLRLL